MQFRWTDLLQESTLLLGLLGLLALASLLLLHLALLNPQR